MNIAIWPANLFSYSVQVTVLIGLGAAAINSLRVRAPGVALPFWQVLLFTCLLLPAVQPWEPVGSGTVAGFSLSTASRSTVSRTPDIAAWVFGLGVALRFAWLGVGMMRLWAYRREAHPFDLVAPCSEQPARKTWGLSPFPRLEGRWRTCDMGCLSAGHLVAGRVRSNGCFSTGGARMPRAAPCAQKGLALEPLGANRGLCPLVPSGNLVAAGEDSTEPRTVR